MITPLHTVATVATFATTATLTTITTTAHRVPSPFATLAVRSEESRHRHLARAPCACVHHLRGLALDPAALGALAALGQQRMALAAFGDIDYAKVTLDELPPDLALLIAQALQTTGVLGPELDPYRSAVTARIDFLGAWGAGFHNDVAGHWPSCLFWNLALAVDDVEFVMPHASVRVALLPGDLIVFDPTMAHGLCRPGDDGQAMAESFESSANSRQIFLSGELPLSDAQWAEVGSPWLPIEEHARRKALDLLAAEFDERSGAIKGLRALAQRMQPDAPSATRT